VLGVAVVSAGTGVSARYPAACTPATNVEAIVDDSGSMGDSDPERLRVAALDLLIDTPANATRTLGALEFGSRADAIFTPQPIGISGPAMKAAVNARIDYGDLFTDYNAAFAGARKAYAGAQAWIFLTDGGHDVAAYLNGHRGGPRTYVVGIGVGAPGANADANRLQRIATDTGGKYYASVDAASLPGVISDIDTKLACA
jgi:hypothetical protein